VSFIAHNDAIFLKLYFELYFELYFAKNNLNITGIFIIASTFSYLKTVCQ